jgi:hypothetical protein
LAKARHCIREKGNQQGRSALLVSSNPNTEFAKASGGCRSLSRRPTKERKRLPFSRHPFLAGENDLTCSHAHGETRHTVLARSVGLLWLCACTPCVVCSRIALLMAPVRFAVIFSSDALFHPEGFFTGDAALCVGMNANTLQVACRLRTRLRRRRSMCKVDELPVFLVTPLHDHHQLAARSSHHDCERTALAAVMESVSLSLFPSLRISRFSRRG